MPEMKPMSACKDILVKPDIWIPFTFSAVTLIIVNAINAAKFNNQDTELTITNYVFIAFTALTTLYAILRMYPGIPSVCEGMYFYLNNRQTIYENSTIDDTSEQATHHETNMGVITNTEEEPPVIFTLRIDRTPNSHTPREGSDTRPPTPSIG